MNLVEKIKLISPLYFVGRVSSDKIKEEETILNLSFSEEYKQYLVAFGEASFNGHEFTGITTIERLNVVNVTLEERKNNPKVPSNFYVIEQANIDGIVIWQLETGEIYQTAPNSEPIKLCDSLSEYMDI